MGKKNDGKKYVATILPNSGDPFEVEIEADSDGSLEHEGQQWVIAPNSVWSSGGKRRVICPEGMAETLSGSAVTGKTYLKARMFFLMMKMALLEQLFNLQNKKPWFKQSGVWIIAGSVALLTLVMVWVASSISGGFEDMADSLRQLRQAINNNGGGSNQPGRNDISPK